MKKKAKYVNIIIINGRKGTEKCMIKIDVKLPPEYTADDIKDAITALIPVARTEIGEIVILKRELKCSDKTNIYYQTSLGVSFSEEREAGLLKMRKKVSEMPDYSFSLPAWR